jgi:ABC-2 type transport system ATP-binding protein
VLSRWATGPPGLNAEERRLTVPVAANAVALPELVRQLDAADLRVADVCIRRPTLDEVFLDRTGVVTDGTATTQNTEKVA